MPVMLFGLIQPTVRGQAGEPPELRVFSRAARAAMRRQVPLVVVLVPTDFLDASAGSPEAVTLNKTVFSVPPVRETLREQFVLTYRRIGPPLSVLPDYPRRGEQLLITVFCTPQKQVLHFFVGVPPVKQLHKDLIGLVDLWLSIRELTDFARQKALVGEFHRSRLTAADLPALENMRHEINDHDLRWNQVVERVRDAWLERLGSRFGANWSAEEFIEVARRMMAHGELEPEVPHFLLALQPLLSLPDFAPTVARSLTGQDYWHAEQVADTAWIAAAVEADSPVLLRTSLKVCESSRLPVEGIRNETIRTLGDRIASRELSAAHLLSLVELSAIRLARDEAKILANLLHQGRTIYVLIDPRTREICKVGHDGQLSGLARRLQQLISDIAER